MKLKLKLGDVLKLIRWLELLLGALQRNAPRDGALSDEDAEVVIDFDADEAEAAMLLHNKLPKLL